MEGFLEKNTISYRGAGKIYSL